MKNKYKVMYTPHATCNNKCVIYNEEFVKTMSNVYNIPFACGGYGVMRRFAQENNLPESLLSLKLGVSFKEYLIPLYSNIILYYIGKSSSSSSKTPVEMVPFSESLTTLF